MPGSWALHLGELSRIEGIRVPAGLCVTTDAVRRIMTEAPSIDDQLDRLSRFEPDDREAIRALSAAIRRALEGIAIPDDLAAAITRPLARLGEQAAYAVRSSATAEDLPTAFFAGQQDTYLNVVGPTAILQHVSRCWAAPGGSYQTSRHRAARRRLSAPLLCRWRFTCETARAASVGALGHGRRPGSYEELAAGGRPRSGTRERPVIALGIRSQGASGEARP